MAEDNFDPDKILEIALKQIEDCLLYRKDRYEQIKKSEDLYFGKTRPALMGSYNFPVPILEGFVETLMSKIDDTIKVQFKKSRESTLKAAKKVTACWDRDAAPDRGDYNSADLDGKKLAIFSGFSTLALIPQSNPYKQELRAVDYYDLLFEPMGGRNIEDHAFKGELNIFKTKYDLEQGIDIGEYNAQQVTKLINGTGNDDKKKYNDQLANKGQRVSSMGLSSQNYNYLGSDVWNLTQLITRINGIDYYVLMERESRIWVKIVPLKKMFHSGLSPYTTWQTERNPASLLCRAPVDGIRPVAEAMQIVLNQSINNIRKRNFDQIAVNIKKIIDINDFEYRPNGVIRFKLNDGESIDNVYRKIETPETSTITINLIQWLDNFMGTKSGVTPGAQGNSNDERVAIYQGNQQQVADRFGMENKFYTQAHQQIAIRYKANLAQYMPARGFMVKFIGLKGIQEEELKKSEANEELDVIVTSQNAEAQIDQKKQEKRTNALLMLQKDQALRTQLSDKWLAEQILRTGEYDEEEIKMALAQEEGANAELMSEAAMAIEEILEGGNPKLNRGANIAFVKKIGDYAIDESDSLDDATYAKLMKYAFDHFPIVEQNMIMSQRLTMQYGQNNQQAANTGTGSETVPATQPAALLGGQGKAGLLASSNPAGNLG